MVARSRIVPFTGLLLALVVPSIGLTRYLPQVAGFDPMYVREWFWWTLLALVLLYVLAIERRPLASIGFRRPSWRTAVLGILAGIVATIGIAAIVLVVFPRLGLHANTSEMNKVLQTPFWYRFSS